MFAKLRGWLIRQSEHYPPRWFWPVVRIYGGPQGSESRTCYMTRVHLGPNTRWGRLYLHVFHREDIDRDPHDHPFPFWTLPLNQGYTELVYNSISECFYEQHVEQGRWSYRPAEHTHRITHCDRDEWPLITLVWRGTTERRWGFWCHSPEQASDDTERFWTPMQDYLYGGEHANIEGRDVACPGTPRRDP